MLVHIVDANFGARDVWEVLGSMFNTGLDTISYLTLSIFIDGVYKGKWHKLGHEQLFALPENRIELWLPKKLNGE